MAQNGDANDAGGGGGGENGGEGRHGGGGANGGHEEGGMGGAGGAVGDVRNALLRAMMMFANVDAGAGRVAGNDLNAVEAGLAELRHIIDGGQAHVVDAFQANLMQGVQQVIEVAARQNPGPRVQALRNIVAQINNLMHGDDNNNNDGGRREPDQNQEHGGEREHRPEVHVLREERPHVPRGGLPDWLVAQGAAVRVLAAKQAVKSKPTDPPTTTTAQLEPLRVTPADSSLLIAIRVGGQDFTAERDHLRRMTRLWPLIQTRSHARTAGKDAKSSHPTSPTASFASFTTAPPDEAAAAATAAVAASAGFGAASPAAAAAGAGFGGGASSAAAAAAAPSGEQSAGPRGSAVPPSLPGGVVQNANVAGDATHFRNMLMYANGSRSFLYGLTKAERRSLRDEACRFGYVELERDLDWFIFPKACPRLVRRWKGQLRVIWAFLDRPLVRTLRILDALHRYMKQVGEATQLSPRDAFIKTCLRLLRTRECRRLLRTPAMPSLMPSAPPRHPDQPDAKHDGTDDKKTNNKDNNDDEDQDDDKEEHGESVAEPLLGLLVGVVHHYAAQGAEFENARARADDERDAAADAADADDDVQHEIWIADAHGAVNRAGHGPVDPNAPGPKPEQVD